MPGIGDNSSEGAGRFLWRHPQVAVAQQDDIAELIIPAHTLAND